MFDHWRPLYNEGDGAGGDAGDDPPEGDEGMPEGDAGDEGDVQTVPYSRFKEVNDARKDLEDKVATLQKKVAGLKGAETKKVEPLQEQINELTQSLEDLQGKLDETEAERERERMKRLRVEVAAAAGIPAELAGRLQGDDRDTLEDDADRLKAFLRESSPGVPPSGDGSGGRPERLDITKMTPAEIREHAGDLMKQAQNST